MAQDLGLHRDPATWMESYPVLKFSREEVEVRRRTWWAVYIVDKCLPLLRKINNIQVHLSLAGSTNHYRKSGIRYTLP